MPEALAIFAVFGVAVAAYVAAWMQARDPANNKPHEEQLRLREQQAWLEQRLQTAQREQWGSDMIASISAELNAITRRLSDLSATAKTG